MIIDFDYLAEEEDRMSFMKKDALKFFSGSHFYNEVYF